MEDSPQEVTLILENYSGDEPIDNFELELEDAFLLEIDAGYSYDDNEGCFEYPDWMEDYSDLHTEYGERAY